MSKRGNMFLKKKAQALVEMGVLGSVVLLALGTMCIFIAKLNSDQFILMESFRRALKKSHDENKAIGYGMWNDRRMVDINQPIIGNKNAHSGAGFAMWAVNSVVANGETGEDPEGELYVSINSPPAMMFFNEYQVEGGSGSIAPEYFTFTAETLGVSTSGHSTSSGRAGGVGEFMIYEIGDSMKVAQGRGYGGGRGLGASN